MRTPGAVGFISPGVAVDIVDSEGRPLPVGQPGSIRIRSSQVARGYVGDPEATAQMFRNGSFYSGDLGYVTADGVLAITGREKSVLLVSGDSVAPEIVEEVLCSFPGIREAAVCTVDNVAGIAEIHALFVGSPDITEAVLRSYCRDKMRPSFIPVRFTAVDLIPRGGQGKIDRPRVHEIAKASLKSL
jgi:long-chain acyl-CoA synthetase